MAAAKPKVNAQSRFNSKRPVMPVRPARMMDLEVINEIHALCFEANHRPLLGADAQPWWNDSAEKLATAPCFVVDGGSGTDLETGRDREGVVGFVYLALPGADTYDTYGGGAPIVDDIYVRPDFQGQGLGAKLLDAAEKYAGMCGYSRAVLACLEVNADSHAFYRKAGWAETGESFVSEADGQRYMVFDKRVEPVTAMGDGGPQHQPAPGMRELSEKQIAEFIDQGFTILKGCIDKELCRQWRDESWERIGMDPDDP